MYPLRRPVIDRTLEQIGVGGPRSHEAIVVTPYTPSPFHFNFALPRLLLSHGPRFMMTMVWFAGFWFTPLTAHTVPVRGSHRPRNFFEAIYFMGLFRSPPPPPSFLLPPITPPPLPKRGKRILFVACGFIQTYMYILTHTHTQAEDTCEL